MNTYYDQQICEISSDKLAVSYYQTVKASSNKLLNMSRPIFQLQQETKLCFHQTIQWNLIAMN